jgi:hypothetical protein
LPAREVFKGDFKVMYRPLPQQEARELKSVCCAAEGL